MVQRDPRPGAGDRGARAPPFVGSVINVRGKVIPLADLRLAFGMEASEADDRQPHRRDRIDLDGEPTLVGIRTDKVHEVTDACHDGKRTAAQRRHALAARLSSTASASGEAIHHRSRTSMPSSHEGASSRRRDAAKRQLTISRGSDQCDFTIKTQTGDRLRHVLSCCSPALVAYGIISLSTLNGIAERDRQRVRSTRLKLDAAASIESLSSDPRRRRTSSLADDARRRSQAVARQARQARESFRRDRWTEMEAIATAERQGHAGLTISEPRGRCDAADDRIRTLARAGNDAEAAARDVDDGEAARSSRRTRRRCSRRRSSENEARMLGSGRRGERTSTHRRA